VGLNRVGITGSSIKIPGWRRYFDPLRSTITRTIPATPDGEVSIDLMAELARISESSAR